MRRTSTKNDKKPAIDAMWEAWVADEFDVVVVESSDRLAWNNRADHDKS